MSAVLFAGQHFHLYRCAAHGHYHILSRLGAVSQPCWSRPALVALIRDQRMLLNDPSDEDQVDAYLDLDDILKEVDALARKQNRGPTGFLPGFVLPRDWQPGEHEVAGPWQRFRRRETEVMSFPANDACGGILMPLFCDFVGRDIVPPRGQSFRDAEWAAYADAPARVIHQPELGIEWRMPETED